MTRPALISPTEWHQTVQNYIQNPNSFLTAHRWVIHHPALYNNKHYPDHNPINAQLDRLQLNFSMDSNRNLTYHLCPLTGTEPTPNSCLNSEGDSYETAILDLASKLLEQYGSHPQPQPTASQSSGPEEPYTVLM